MFFIKMIRDGKCENGEVPLRFNIFSTYVIVVVILIALRITVLPGNGQSNLYAGLAPAPSSSSSAKCLLTIEQ